MGMDGFLKNVETVAEGVIARGVSVVKVLRHPGDEKLSDSPDSIEFTYVGTDDKGEYVGQMFYSDEYFEKPSTVYNPSLATASIAVAMSCGNSQAGYEMGSRNAEALMCSMGFGDIEHNESYESISTLDTIGVVMGSRDIGGIPLLCVGIRGIGYGSEWGSNLIIGTGTYHQGFDEASNSVIRFISEYIRKHGLSGRLKLWVTGYSRSASTANLVAGKIDTAIADSKISEMFGEGIILEPSDIYAYCFEPAETVMADAFELHGSLYSNIWNHINPNDPIPIMVTACLGMERFGNDLRFPCSADTNYRGRRDRMLDFYRRLPNRKEIGICRTDLFKAIKAKSLDDGRGIEWPTQLEFLTEFNRKFAEFVGSREYYADNLQSGLSEYVARRNAYEGSDQFKDCFREAMADNKLSVISAILAMERDDPEGVARSLRGPVTEAVRKSKMDPALVDDLTAAVSGIMMIFKGFIRNNRLLFFNFLINSKTIFFAHYPELIFSWLMSSDPNYT